MTKIIIENAVSTLQTTPNVLKIVRRHVALQKRKMPPIEAQKIIKEFFKTRRRFGVGSDFARLFADGQISELLRDHGVTEKTLTTSQLETTLRQRGVWDGWVRLVERNGSFATGLQKHVERALTLRADEEFEIEDLREEPSRSVGKKATISLYDYQKEAVAAFLACKRGVINLPPRSGKTRIAVAIANELGVPCLYVAPSVGIVEQTAKVFRTLLPEKATIAVHGGLSAKSRKKMMALQRADIIITTPQTAVKLPNIHKRLLLIMDEFHHAAAKTWRAVSSAANCAYWRLGLTGTHFRADGNDLLMTGVLGRAIYSRSVSDMVALGRLVPAHIAMIRVRQPIRASGYAVYKDGVVDHQERNLVLTQAANLLVEKGRRVLVLCKEIEHASVLSSMIAGSVAVDGRDNERVDKSLQDLAAGRVLAVVGTSVIGEGRDVPAADALVYAAGGQSKVKVVQDYFRALTASEGKESAIVVDAADTQHPILLEHAAKRLQHYRSESSFKAQVVDFDQFRYFLEGCP